MYLRTPKRYRRQRRQLRLFSGRTLFLLAVIPAVVYVGWLIWDNQATVRSSVLPEIEGFAESVQTQVAPRPTATPTPNLGAAQSGCASAYQQGHMTEAIQQCSVLAEGNPNDVGLHYRVAQMLIITSNFGRNNARMKQALEFSEKTINADPEAPDGWSIRAMALDWSGDAHGALASALHAKALDDQFAPTYAVLGEVYHDLGKNEVALHYLDQALALDTGGIAVAYTFRTRGLVLSNQGLYEDALQPYQAALQNAPNQSYIAIELAWNYIALGEMDRALQLLASALERDPSDTSVLFNLANAHLRNGDAQRAYEYYLRCLEVDVENVPCLSWLGGLQYSQGDYATAVVSLGRAIEFGSDDPDDFYQIGHSYAAMGQCAQALPYFEKGLQIAVEQDNPDDQAKFISEMRSCGTLNPQPSGSP
jgi:tetratricopeptide (TPR) repeat protein